MLPSVGNMCSTDSDSWKPLPSNSDNWKDSTWWWLPSWLKIVLIILVWWLLAMGWVIVFFSIKAKLNSTSDEDEEW
jgi:hypothetical protein